MIDTETDALVFHVIHSKQEPHPVEEMWSLEDLINFGEAKAHAAVKTRAARIAEMTEHPLECCWVPPDWWLFLLLLCERRLELPGAVLELFISGGLRGGKSFIFAMLTVLHWKFTREADIFCLSGSQPTSEKLQQQPIQKFLPPEALNYGKGSIKQTMHQRAKFSGGKFTDNKFSRKMTVKDEAGLIYTGGGSVEWRMFTQDPELLKGYALTFVWWDEQCPVIMLEQIFNRLVSRASQTRDIWHRNKMKALHAQLKALVDGTSKTRPHPALLGALMHGVMAGSYTPEEGYVPSVRRYLQGATKPDQYKVIAPELEGKAGVLDPRVPKIALCASRRRLAGYLHTSANKMVDSYTELSAAAKDWDERTIRIKLYGDAEASENVLFTAFTDDHIQPWKHVPRDGTIYIADDPAPVKPWSIGAYLADALGRVWCLEEWPSPGKLITLKDSGAQIDPGAWAVATSGNNLNGDKGPAAKLRLNYTFTDYTRIVWELLSSVLVKFEHSGSKFTGRISTTPLKWKDGHELSGPFAMPERAIADKRYLGVTERRGEEVKSNHDWLLEEEHALDWEIHKDDSQAIGVMAIQRALTMRAGGMPGLIVVAERNAAGELVSGCLDTIFAMRTYTVPDGKDAPLDNDQACKEAIDRLRYLLKSGAEFVDTTVRGRPGGSFGSRR